MREGGRERKRERNRERRREGGREGGREGDRERQRETEGERKREREREREGGGYKHTKCGQRAQQTQLGSKSSKRMTATGILHWAKRRGEHTCSSHRKENLLP